MTDILVCFYDCMFQFSTEIVLSNNNLLFIRNMTYFTSKYILSEKGIFLFRENIQRRIYTLYAQTS